MSPEKILQDLLESIIVAKAHYQTWWALANEARPKFIPIMNQFVDFFITTQDAHFNSMIMNLAHLFDTRRDASTLINYLKSEKSNYTSVEFKNLKDEINKLTELAKPILEIRHKTVAHKDQNLNEIKVFQSASITPNQIRDLIFSCANLVNDLRQRKGWPNGVFESQRFTESTLNVIQCLDNYRKLTMHSGHPAD